MTPDELKEQAERLLRERRDAFRIFKEHEKGEECLKHIEFLGYVHRSAVALDQEGRVDPYILAFREGRRSLAIEIRNHVTALAQPPIERQERAVSALAGS